MNKEKTISLPSFCGKDCGGDACPLLAVLENSVVKRMAINPAGKGIKPCPRGYSLHLAHYAADRLTKPLIASGPKGSGKYKEAGWEEALSLIAQRISKIQAKNGHETVLAMGSSGSTGALHDSQALLQRFLYSVGGCSKLGSNYSNGAAAFVLPYLFGNESGSSGWDAASVRHSKLIVLWGANILEARLGAELGTEVARASRNGIPVICIDPRRSRSIKTLGAEWIGIRPGTDLAMMLAVLYEFFRNGKVDRKQANRLAHGMEELEAYVCGQADGIERSPAWAEKRCGVPAETIKAFAKKYAENKPVMLIPGYSIQRVHNGEDSFRMTVALQIASGNFGLMGGSSGSINSRLPGPKISRLPAWTVKGQAISYPILRWPDAILAGTEESYYKETPSVPIKAAYIAGFNALGQGADINKSYKALKTLEFSVCHDLFLTPTAKMCDVVLPVLSPLEKGDIGIPWAGNYVLYKTPVLPPRGMARSDYSIFSELCERLGHGSTFSEDKSEEAWIESFINSSEIKDKDSFKAIGIYFGERRPASGFSRFANAPQENPLSTPSGKVEVLSSSYAKNTGGSELPAWTDAKEEDAFPFYLVSPKTIHRTHSQNGGGESWASKSQNDKSPEKRPDYGELTMHPSDAKALQLSDKDKVIVKNNTGSLAARLSLSTDIIQGVVCIHEGVWANLDEEGPKNNSYGAVNQLSLTYGSGPSFSAVMHGIRVMVEKAI
ncbi:molybdopterin-dependent oxidoreductase [Spirochaetota bacterium]